MSILHRKGFEPYLSLGNKKSVDIVITDKKLSTYITLDVKGVIKGNWLLGNHIPKADFMVLVTYLDRFSEDELPECYILPNSSIKGIAKKYTNKGYSISYSKIRNQNNYKNNWGLLTQR